MRNYTENSLRENGKTVSIEQAAPFGIVRGPLYGHMGVKADVFMPQVHRLGAHLVRLFLLWEQIEPERGHFVWDAVDTLLEQLEAGDEVWITLNASSLWATRHATTFQPPSPALRPEEYAHFVSELVKHCKGRVRYWQCENEPTNPMLWEGTAQEYASQLRVFAQAVREGDAEAIVVLAGAVDSFHPSQASPNPDAQAEQDFFEYLLRESPADFDVFDLHLYGDLYSIPANVDAVRLKMAAQGYQKPILCGEYNGPSFFNFPENLSVLQSIFEQMLSSPQSDTLAQATQSGVVAQLYAQMTTLPPQAQMFMEGCSPELEAKRHRINCRELVSRAILALSAGVQKMLCWNLANEKVDPHNLMHLLFDKHKLLDYEKGQFKQPYPAAETFRLLTHLLASVERVRRIELAAQPEIYLFEITRGDRTTLFVVWERREAFSGENEPATSFTWPWPVSRARVTDVFGASTFLEEKGRQLHLPISLTPLFVEFSK